MQPKKTGKKVKSSKPKMVQSKSLPKLKEQSPRLQPEENPVSISLGPGTPGLNTLVTPVKPSILKNRSKTAQKERLSNTRIYEKDSVSYNVNDNGESLRDDDNSQLAQEQSSQYIKGLLKRHNIENDGVNTTNGDLDVSQNSISEKHVTIKAKLGNKMKKAPKTPEQRAQAT